MRCLSCDVELNDFEATRKYATSGDFVDLCNRCFDTIRDQVPVVERSDLAHSLDWFEDTGADPDFPEYEHFTDLTAPDDGDFYEV